MIDPEELEKRALRLGAFSQSAITTGNTVVVFTLLLLQEILERLALDPVTNLANITSVANSIASLNNSIKIDP